MGDVIVRNINSIKPFIPRNNTKISDSIIESLQLDNLRESEKGHLLQHITQVDLYLDTIFNHLSNNEKKQISIYGNNLELNTSKILYLLEKLLKIKEIFLFSNDLLLYPKVINEIKAMYKIYEINEECVYFIHLNYTQILTNNTLDKIKSESIIDINSDNCIFKITINAPLINEQFEIVFDFFIQLSIPVIYIFIVEQEKDIELFDMLISEYNLENYEIKPVYTGINLTLFKDNVFVNEKDIMSSQVSAKEISIRKEINPNFFGKIAILPNGKISFDLQKSNYTEIFDNSLYKQIYNEITEGEGLWKLTRDKVEPCKTCMYKFLCPPISEYELKLKSFNLCTYN